MNSKVLSTIIGMTFVATPVMANEYTKALRTLENAPASIKSAITSAPKTYNFTSRFDGKSSVSYTGQSFRQVLLSDIKSYMSGIKAGLYLGRSEKEAIESFNSYFKYDSDNDSMTMGSISGVDDISVSVKGHDLEEEIYDDLQYPGKNLVGKIAGNDNSLRNKKLLGWSSMTVGGVNLKNVDADGNGDSFVEPEDLIQALFQVMAKNAESGEAFRYENGVNSIKVVKAENTKDGLNLTQLVQKILHTSVSFSQAAGDYMSTDLGSKKGLNADNTAKYKGTKNYTALEHHWDEAFGYFGAARDYANYTIEQITNKHAIDTDGNGYISLKSEKTLGIARNSARMDLYIKTKGDKKSDLSGKAIRAFIAGRHLISTQPEGYAKYVKALSVVALGEWEKTLAYTTVHYINSTLSQMKLAGKDNYNFLNHTKYWSEMKGFGMAAQFSPVAIMSISDFEKFHELVGDKPALLTQGKEAFEQYRKNLLAARLILKKAYGISSKNIEIL
jgi:hypothetical protein